MKHRLFWVVCVGFVFGLGLGQPSVGGDQNVIYAKGRWTRLLEGEWYVRGVSKAPEVAHLFRDYRRQTPEERLLKFGNPFDCFSRFTAEEVKVLHLPTMSLREGQVHYRESGNQNDKIRFVLIEPGAAILLYDQWRSALSPNGRRIVYIHGARGVLEDRSRSLDIVEVFSPQGGVYSSVETSRQITPGPERGESVLAFEAYKSLLFNEGLGEGDEDSGIPWPVWLVSVVGWASDTEVLYLSHRTTDLQHAWLTKDKDWLAKKRWSLWRMPVTDRVEPEQLVWDSQTLGEQVLEVRVLPHLQLLVETHDHILVIDREGRTGMTLAKADWEFPAVLLDPQHDLWGGSFVVAVSADGSALLLQKRSTQELWMVKTDGGQPIKLPAVPAPFPLERRVYVSLAPDGGRLAYFAVVEGEPALVVLEVHDPPSFKLYRLEDPQEVLEPQDATGRPRFISWVRNDTLILPAIRRKDRPTAREREAYWKAQSTWLLQLAEEGKP